MEPINLSYLKELSGGDNEFIIDMLETYIEETSSDIEQLLTAINNKNLGKIAFITHRLKSAFQMFGLVESKELAQEIELMAKANRVPIHSLRVPIIGLIENAKASCLEASTLIESFQ